MSAAAPAARPKFNTKKGLLHGALTAIVVVAVVGAAAAALGVADPYRAGKAAAPLVLLAFGIAFGISWMFQTGRRGAGWASLGGVLLAVGVSVVMAALTTGQLELPTRYRAPLQATGQGEALRLVHPLMGWSMASPGGAFDRADSLAERMTAGDPGAHSWGWLRHDDGAIVVASLYLGLGAGGDGGGDVNAFLDGLAKSTALAGAQRTVDWRGEGRFRLSGEVRQQAVVATGLKIRKPDFEGAVMLLTIGLAPAEAEALHRSLEL